MKDKMFIDTNILVYAKFEEEDEADKNKIASDLLEKLDTKPIVSVQVLNEFASVLLKHEVADEDVEQIVKEITEGCVVIPLGLGIVWNTWKIRKKYGFSYWDSMIISAALESECTILYSEDLQHGQVIEKKLKVMNPFENSGK